MGYFLSCKYMVAKMSWLTRTGTANKILEDKERQRAKELGKGDKAKPRKKARR